MTSKKTSRKVCISNERVNVYGSRVLTGGIDYSQYERNPILLWMHRRGDVSTTIGTVKNIAIEGDTLVGELSFDGIGETAKMIEEKWDAGTLKMVSANFDIIELSDKAEHVVPGQKAFTVTKSKLVEVSVVDIGGNDDALVLLKQNGHSIALSNEDKGIKLPLLSGQLLTPKKNNMDFKTIALKLGLPEAATEAEILETISVVLGYKAELDTLKAEVDTIRLANVTSLVDAAVSARKITADKKEHFIELGKKVGADSLKLTLDSMVAAVRPTDIVGGSSQQLSGDTSEYKKLSDVPADKIMELRTNDKDTYMKLYRAEYGVECEITE